MRKRKLKCWQGNYDGVRRALICATSQRDAAAVAGCSVGHFLEYFVPLEEPVEPAASKPLTLFTKPFDFTREHPWTEGRCKLPPSE